MRTCANSSFCDGEGMREDFPSPFYYYRLPEEFWITRRSCLPVMLLRTTTKNMNHGHQSRAEAIPRSCAVFLCPAEGIPESWRNCSMMTTNNERRKHGKDCPVVIQAPGSVSIDKTTVLFSRARSIVQHARDVRVLGQRLGRRRRPVIEGFRERMNSSNPGLSRSYRQ
jgi:hypothetical protein